MDENTAMYCQDYICEDRDDPDDVYKCVGYNGDQFVEAYLNRPKDLAEPIYFEKNQKRKKLFRLYEHFVKYVDFAYFFCSFNYELALKNIIKKYHERFN